ncbi:MAG: substrate-binding domain-containing protein [Bacteroidota bacterium]
MELFFRVLCWICLITCFSCSGSEPSGDSSSSSDSSTSSGKRESSTSGDIAIVVDETLKPIIQAEVENFEFLYKNASIHPIYLPGEAAIEALLQEDSLRLVISTRELNFDEKEYLKEQKTVAKYSLIATDAIALIIHRDNVDSVLTKDMLPKIFSGEINKWSQINPESNLGPIQLVFDHAQSSTVQYILENVIPGDSLRKDVNAGKSNPEVLEFVGSTPNALGVIGVSWISDQDDSQARGFRKGIRVMELEVDSTCSFVDAYGERFYQPYQGVVKEGCYPLSRGIYAILREPRIGLGTGFVAHLASDAGQRIILKSGLVPERAITRMVKFPEKE